MESHCLVRLRSSKILRFEMQHVSYSISSASHPAAYLHTLILLVKRLGVNQNKNGNSFEKRKELKSHENHVPDEKSLRMIMVISSEFSLPLDAEDEQNAEQVNFGKTQ